MNEQDRNRNDTDAGRMTIRRAEPRDIPQIDVLLHQVLDVHHAGRPDLFKPHATKYTDDQLAGIIADDRTPVFVAVEPGAGSIADPRERTPRGRTACWAMRSASSSGMSMTTSSPTSRRCTSTTCAWTRPSADGTSATPCTATSSASPRSPAATT